MVKQGRRKINRKEWCIRYVQSCCFAHWTYCPSLSRLRTFAANGAASLKKSEFALFKLHRYCTTSKLNFEKCRWIFLNLQYSTQVQEKIEKKIIRELFFTCSMKIKIRKFSCSNVTKMREARAKRSLFCWSDPLLFSSNVGAARTVFPHWSQKIITNLPNKRSFSYSVILFVFKGFQNIWLYVRIYFHAVVLRPLNKG